MASSYRLDMQTSKKVRGEIIRIKKKVVISDYTNISLQYALQDCCHISGRATPQALHVGLSITHKVNSPVMPVTPVTPPLGPEIHLGSIVSLLEMDNEGLAVRAAEVRWPDLNNEI